MRLVSETARGPFLIRNVKEPVAVFSRRLQTSSRRRQVPGGVDRSDADPGPPDTGDGVDINDGDDRRLSPDDITDEAAGDDNRKNWKLKTNG